MVAWVRTLLLLGLTLGLAAEDLLDRVMAAQQEVRVVQGELTMTTSRVDEPDAVPTAYPVAFFVELPDRYHLRFDQPGDDSVEWRISDGVHAWYVSQLFAGDQPELESERAVADDGWGFQRVVDFLRLERSALVADFTVAIDEAARQVTLEPRDPELRAEVLAIVVELDAALHTSAVTLSDHQGNVTRFVVDRADYDSELPAGLFAIDWAAR
ncbi:MAG: LolA family protein [Planctomycetota bacterium]